MHRLFRDKRSVLTIALLALFSLVLLAGSLGNVDFRPVRSLGSSSNPVSKASVNLGEMIQNAADIPFWNQLIFWGMMFLWVLLATSLLNPELRKRFILGFIRLAVFVLGFLYLIRKNPDVFAGLLDRLTLSGILAGNSQGSDTPAPVFRPPQVSNWLSFAVALGLALLVVLLIWWLKRVWTRIRELSSASGPFDKIARIARTSLGELRSGRNFENAIIECYARMSTVVGEKKGLHREDAMTPAEFSARLTRAGLPREPVERLTRLFESIRYGGQPAGQSEIHEAITSLTSILRYCGEQA